MTRLVFSHDMKAAVAYSTALTKDNQNERHRDVLIVHDDTGGKRALVAHWAHPLFDDSENCWIIHDGKFSNALRGDQPYCWAPIEDLLPEVPGLLPGETKRPSAVE